MGFESTLVCNRLIREGIYSRSVLTFAKPPSATLLHIMPREASPAEGRFVQTAFWEVRRLRLNAIVTVGTEKWLSIRWFAQPFSKPSQIRALITWDLAIERMPFRNVKV